MTLLLATEIALIMESVLKMLMNIETLTSCLYVMVNEAKKYEIKFLVARNPI